MSYSSIYLSQQILIRFSLQFIPNRSVILWNIRDLTQKEHKTLRVNIEYDHASFISWSPDSKAFGIHRTIDNNIEIYKIDKKKDGMIGKTYKVLSFDKAHKEDVIGFSISPNGLYIISCSNKTDLIIWDLKGHQLERIDTYLMSTYTAKISPCGRFIVATGFTPDVKVMEVSFTKTGEFKHVTKAYELTGPSSGVYDVAFDADTSHIATLSKDGYWRFYDTKIEYSRGESVLLISSGTYDQTSNPPQIALSPDAHVTVVSTENTLQFFKSFKGVLYKTIENVFTGPITRMKFDASGKYLFVSGDRSVRVFHNVTGYATQVNKFRELLKTNITSAARERYENTLQECNLFLKCVGENME